MTTNQKKAESVITHYTADERVLFVHRWGYKWSKGGNAEECDQYGNEAVLAFREAHPNGLNSIEARRPECCQKPSPKGCFCIWQPDHEGECVFSGLGSRVMADWADIGGKKKTISESAVQFDVADTRGASAPEKPTCSCSTYYIDGNGEYQPTGEPANSACPIHGKNRPGQGMVGNAQVATDGRLLMLRHAPGCWLLVGASGCACSCGAAEKNRLGAIGRSYADELAGDVCPGHVMSSGLFVPSDHVLGSRTCVESPFPTVEKHNHQELVEAARKVARSWEVARGSKRFVEIAGSGTALAIDALVAAVEKLETR